MDREQLAWASGVFCGEGCFYTPRTGVKSSACATLGQAGDSLAEPPEMIRRLLSITGLGTARLNKHSSNVKKKGGRTTPVWVWRVHGCDNIRRLIEMLSPWLTPEKRRDADRLLEWYGWKRVYKALELDFRRANTDY